MGALRDDPSSQRAYLGQMATRFAEIRLCALNAWYTSDKVFDRRDDLKIVTHIREMSEDFTAAIFSRGHTYPFQDLPGFEYSYGGGHGAGSTENSKCGLNTTTSSLGAPSAEDYPELDDIISEPPAAGPMFPDAEDITAVIRHVHTSTRGLELGTFNPSATSMVFKEQSQKWESITIVHVNSTILVVHDFIFKLLHLVCPDPRVRGQIWTVLSEELLDGYRAALEHARFLLSTTRQGSALSLTPEYEGHVSKIHGARQAQKAGALTADSAKMMETLRATGVKQNNQQYVAENRAVGMINTSLVPLFISQLVETRNADSMCDMIHDVLYGYYLVTRSRFVDNVYQQVIDHFLLSGDKSPLRVFGPDRVLRFTEDELRRIAGEEPQAIRRREVLQREIANLEAGRKALARVCGRVLG
ncbi:hypothetical protein MAPG_01610 [Magnaporthiopsis poae ATCC 64411]|uniref:GED domain-containing protein n=1 Tax=Magnaporthiopsis poae (strain ATCC 64411 / 73-15) TaxID=644358 RepID=A0A0C4DP56_MAGP6|nr:hypothetical protein MAPG_01610 [Magnaporthiopsis poae ATCC 64411]